MRPARNDVSKDDAGVQVDPSAFTILIVEDDEDLLKILTTSFARSGYRVEGSSQAKTGLAAAKKGGIDLILADFQMPEMNGLELLGKMKEADPSIPVIIMTAFGTISMAVEAMKIGAYDYVTKPFHLEELKLAVSQALKYRSTVKGNGVHRHVAPRVEGFDGMIGKSPAFRGVVEVARKVARTDATILLTGESGTGKDLVAWAIHHQSARTKGPFVAINCASIPETLLEAELFGYRKGAFTGATKDKAGRFEDASEGTLFLDEIGEMKYELQAKLLRAIQERTMVRIGDNHTIPFNVRIIAASNRDLEQHVRDGGFREDLFYRLSVISIQIPALRERREDIPLLVTHFLDRFAADAGLSIDEAAMQRLRDHSWPGNVRELENVIERMVILRESDHLGVADLPPGFGESANGTSTQGIDSLGNLTLPEAERLMILNTLKKNNWNKARTARELGIERHILLYRLKKFNISATK